MFLGKVNKKYIEFIQLYFLNKKKLNKLVNEFQIGDIVSSEKGEEKKEKK